jgi:hypothetical protein
MGQDGRGEVAYADVQAIQPVKIARVGEKRWWAWMLEMKAVWGTTGVLQGWIPASGEPYKPPARRDQAPKRKLRLDPSRTNPSRS